MDKEREGKEQHAGGTYSEALSRKGGGGFGRGRGEECVSIVGQTHLLSLPRQEERRQGDKLMACDTTGWAELHDRVCV